AKAVGQSTFLSTDTTPSRASPLPQVFVSELEGIKRSELAVNRVLHNLVPPPECRNNCGSEPARESAGSANIVVD
ncbi:hypothetical protein, partial [Pseudomonas sp. FW305-3-2-15-E-TSA2]|uniref:hypothetical protein n=1 Tax=Pseudomonas sp. FW305-3-2-15-E-TSA2 TaxID=2751336 RepID=UPI001C43A6DC